MVKKRKWTQRKPVKKSPRSQTEKRELEIGKRSLVDVMIINGIVEKGSGEKKLRGPEVSSVAK